MTISKTLSRLVLIGFVAMSTVACNTTGMISGPGIKNQDLLQAAAMQVNIEAQTVENMDAETTMVYNRVLAQGMLAEAGNRSFDPMAAWTKAQNALNARKATMSDPIRTVLMERFQKANKGSGAWVVQ